MPGIHLGVDKSVQGKQCWEQEIFHRYDQLVHLGSQNSVGDNAKAFHCLKPLAKLKNLPSLFDTKGEIVRIFSVVSILFVL